ncbi:MAG: PP2C family protein-serine/threonine phosphatase [Bryobacteraceae bacterium]
MAHKADNYRWFKIWIGAGIVAGIGLVANSISNYRFVVQKVAADSIHRELSAQAAAVDRQFRDSNLASARSLATVLESLRQHDAERIAFAQIRDMDGNILAHAGIESGPVFSRDVIRAKMDKREPITTSVPTAEGEAFVEAFPIRLPAAVSPTLYRPVAMQQGPGRRNFGILEIAGYMKSADPVFWPLRRNLAINVTAGLALLASLALMALRFRSYVAARQVASQVELARQVQQDLLPPSGQQTCGDFEVAADSTPASQMSGDFFDVLRRGEGLAFVLGDVSGKGVPAALLMGVLHGAVRTSSWTQSESSHELSTAKINRLLCENSSRERFASMFWGYTDSETGMLHYVNAGHFAPLVFRKGESTPIRLEEGGPVLGLLPGARYEQGSVRLEEDDVLVLYSDGIIEAAGADGAMFGEQRLVRIVEQNLDLSSEQIRDRILSAVSVFTGKAQLEDDRTLLVIKHRAAAAARDVVREEVVVVAGEPVAVAA